MTKLLLVRHGESEYNSTRRFAGFVDIDLTDKGRRQVKMLRERLAEEKIDAVYTSNLKRARMTAEIIISGRSLNIVECPELSEVSYGDVEGLTFIEIQQQYPTLATHIRRSDLAMDFPGGESFMNFIKRVESFKVRLDKHETLETVLIVAHGGPLRVLLLSLLGISQAFWGQLRIDNASLSVVDIQKNTGTDVMTHSSTVANTGDSSKRVILSLFNETSHLMEKPEHRPPQLAAVHQQSEEVIVATTEVATASKEQDIVIQLLKASDIPVIYSAFTGVGYQRTPGMLEKYLVEQEKGERIVLIANFRGDFAGYVTVKWQVTDYAPFAERGIPEIMDLNVLPTFRKRRIATRLVDEAERHIFEHSSRAGIGVGLFADYGAAQRMYVRRGYVPDGWGISYWGQPVRPYSNVRVDHELVLYLTKEKEGSEKTLEVESTTDKWFADLKEQLEASYLQQIEPWKQSGFMISDPKAWKVCRKPIADCVEKSGTFLDIGCANGYLLETVLGWTQEKGVKLIPFGVDMSEKLVSLAKQRLPIFENNFFVENAYYWKNPPRFDYVHSELVYVPDALQKQYLEKLLDSYLKPGGRLLITEYRSRKDPPDKVWTDTNISGWGIHIERKVSGFYEGKEMTRVIVITGIENAVDNPMH
jgi:broad specificity phosphatase PhoE/GNAT superfamily N-acetyltransferase